MQAFSSLLAVLLLAACAAEPPSAPVVADRAGTPVATDDRVCVREAPTGSKMIATRCYTSQAWHQTQRDAKDSFDGMGRNRPPPAEGFGR